jgi:hypothetical protein
MQVSFQENWVVCRCAEVARNKVARCSFSGKISRWWKTGKPAASSQQPSKYYAAFFCPARTFAYLARCAAAIFLRAAADILFLLGMLTTFRFCPPFARTFATVLSGQPQSSPLLPLTNGSEFLPSSRMHCH